MNGKAKWETKKERKEKKYKKDCRILNIKSPLLFFLKQRGNMHSRDSLTRTLGILMLEHTSLVS